MTSIAHASPRANSAPHIDRRQASAAGEMCVLRYAHGAWTVESNDCSSPCAATDLLLNRPWPAAPQIHLQSEVPTKIQVARCLLDQQMRLRHGVRLEDLCIRGAAAKLLAAHAEAVVSYRRFAGPDASAALELETCRLVVDCMRGAYRRSTHSPTEERTDAWRPARRYWFHLVWWHIEMNLGNRMMTPLSICTDLGISRSALYRHFSPDGGLARYIRNRRLDTVHTLIKDSPSSYSAKSLAHQSGLRNSGQLSRLFERKFGHRLSVAVQSEAADHEYR